ncbi:hypothetical protein TSAR_015091 [Trichomalopsis sarcophagae]|uniref:Reverse transcriptase domain-containing protein n=1 Tax=Trichomalopsis sarcophagae TaxID=543379 RepID=A0A232F9R9_9HYME|nr:hypothetical protein TSAR_015091 [Trichomalopsis sarcophagae]
MAQMLTQELLSFASLGIKAITEEQRLEIDDLMKELLPDPFCEQLGCTGLIYHDIDVGIARPIKQWCYLASKILEDGMHEQVHKMLLSGIIKRSKSNWSSPVVMVRKSYGSFRFCVDYEKVNAVSKIAAYPLRYVDMILRKIQHARYVTALDCSGAFLQIPLTERSIPITAFTVPGLGLFEFVSMPYGLSGRPATFQMLADKLITPKIEPVAYAYLDDIIIATVTFSDHIEWLTFILKRINEAGLTINHKKSKICMSQELRLSVIERECLSVI